MSAPVEAAGDTLGGGYSFADYDVSPDGQRFVMFPAGSGPGRTEHPHVMLVTRWFEELAKQLPPARN
jgi:hypothetical protein